MLVVPETERHPALQKVELDLEKLHAVTLEALSSWFTDKNSPGNQKKKTILDDIFKVAKQELRYNDGEIGAFDRFQCLKSRNETYQA